MNISSQHLASNETIPTAQATPSVMRWLALGAVASPILFTLAWVVLGFMSPGYTLWGKLIAPYSPISQPVSGLGLGPTAPFMNAAFVLSGLLLMLGVIGIFQTTKASSRAAARWACIALLAPSAAGLVIDGIFHLDSILLHLTGFLLASATPVLSFLVTGFFFRHIPSFRRFGNWLLLGSPLTLLLVVLFFLTFNQAAAGTNQGVAGLTERILAIEVLAWFVPMGWLAFRRS